MPAANIKYPNLRAEMARKNITIQDIAEVITTGRDTAGASCRENVLSIWMKQLPFLTLSFHMRICAAYLIWKMTKAAERR